MHVYILVYFINANKERKQGHLKYLNELYKMLVVKQTYENTIERKNYWINNLIKLIEYVLRYTYAYITKTIFYRHKHTYIHTRAYICIYT